MLKSADYILIELHAVRHVGLKLEGAAPAALSFSDIAKDYDHPVPADLTRVKRFEKTGTDAAAREWVIRYAASMMKGIVVDGDMVSFAPGKGFDDLRWNGKKIERPGPDIHATLRNAFSPISGEFADNIRIDNGDLTELRASMTSWGWIDRPQFRALGDRLTKVILIGHRRIVIAKELGIDWESRVDWVDIGNGDAADAERFKLAIASNIGAKPLTPTERKRIATFLYSEPEWTMERIGEALNVTTMTISRDLGEFNTMLKSKRGRPRGDSSVKTLVEKTLDRSDITPEQEKQVAALVDQGRTRQQIVKETGLGKGTVEAAKQRYVGRLLERQEQAVKPEPAEHTCTCPICGHIHPVS